MPNLPGAGRGANAPRLLGGAGGLPPASTTLSAVALTAIWTRERGAGRALRPRLMREGACGLRRHASGASVSTEAAGGREQNGGRGRARPERQPRARTRTHTHTGVHEGKLTEKPIATIYLGNGLWKFHGGITVPPFCG